MPGISTQGFPLGVIGDHLAPGGAASKFEPQRQSNWLISIAGVAGENNIRLALEAAALPSVAVEEIPLNFLNTTRWVAGRAIYDTIPLVVKDMVDVGVASAIKDWHEQVYNPETHKIGLAKNYKKVADLVLFGPDGELQRTWSLLGCWPVSVNYGQLDMNSSDKVLIETVLRYDRARALGF